MVMRLTQQGGLHDTRKRLRHQGLVGAEAPAAHRGEPWRAWRRS